MRKLVLVAAVAALILVALPIGPAGADSPFEAVSIEVDTVFPDVGPSNGPFIATGPAVDAGLICANGWTVDLFGKPAPREGSPRGINIQVFKAFLCDATGLPEGPVDDGFIVKLQVRIDKKGNNYSWNIKDGWGAYEGLRGHGSGFGVYNMDFTEVTDYFAGMVR